MKEKDNGEGKHKSAVTDLQLSLGIKPGGTSRETEAGKFTDLPERPVWKPTHVPQEMGTRSHKHGGQHGGVEGVLFSWRKMENPGVESTLAQHPAKVRDGHKVIPRPVLTRFLG